MKYWFDTEFIEYPCTIDLISIGIVAEDGRTFYAESTEVDWSKASQWVLDNVKPWLGVQQFADYYLCHDRAHVRDAVRTFIGADTPEFWAYYADYDWVVFCWLFGTMINLPSGWPKFCRDVKQLADALGSPRLPKQSTTEHHALADAQWTREAYEFLR